MSQPRLISDQDLSRRPARGLTEILLSSEFLESIPDAMVAVERNGTIVQLNSQTEDLFGYRRLELMGQKIEVLVPERFRRRHHTHREGFAESPKIRRMGQGLDLYGRRRDGSEFPVEISLSPMSVEGREVVLSAIRDITDRKRIENALRQANEELDRKTTEEIGEYRGRLAAIIDSSTDAIIGKNLDGTITAWNKGAEQIYGYRSNEVIGNSITLLTPPDRAEEVFQLLDRIRQGQSVDHFESIRVTKDGRRLNMFLTVSPIRDAGGRVVGAAVIARDVTAQKRAEDQLRQAQKMEAIGRLAGGVAHDFNNVLGIVTACTDLLRDRTAAAEAGPYLANIQKAVDRGRSLTRQLLAFSRKTVVQPEVLELNQRLQEVSRLLRPLMGDDVEIVIAARVPQAIVEVDPGQFDQVVLNLAVNSRDAMLQGGKFILETSAVEADKTFGDTHHPMTPGKYVLLAVSDTGSGMDPATQSHIFEPFFTTKELGKGTGLGLATVYGIVQQAGGHIWVYSEPGRGTTFKIYLPSAEHKVVKEETPAAEVVTPGGHGNTILLVEDDELMLRLTHELLEQHGYTVLEAKDGKTALEVAEAHAGKIDLLLTDVVMRGTGGPDLMTALSASHPQLKTVFMSGYTGELLNDAERFKGGVALLEKPFTRLSLLRTVHAALKTAQARNHQDG